MLFRQQSEFRRRNGNRRRDKSEVGPVCAEVLVLKIEARQAASRLYIYGTERGSVPAARSLFPRNKNMLVHIEKSSHFRLAGVCSSKRRSFAGEARRRNGCCPGVSLHPSNWDLRMSSMPPRRALTFPIVWEPSGESAASATHVPKTRIPTDEETMARLQANDTSALEILFDRYARLVFRIARGVVRDTGEAEDVVQEAFFHLYKKCTLFDRSKGSVKNWILQVALHRALDRKEHLTRRGFYLGTDLASLDDTLLGGTDLEREIGSKLNRAQLQKAFAELPDVQRVTLELFYFEGLDLREISEKLSEPLGNTRHHFYRGLERLRKSTFVQNLRETKRC